MDPDTSPCNYSQFSTKMPKTKTKNKTKQTKKPHTLGKDNVFNKWCQENGMSTQRVKLDLYLFPHKNHLQTDQPPQCET